MSIYKETHTDHFWRYEFKDFRVSKLSVTSAFGLSLSDGVLEGRLRIEQPYEFVCGEKKYTCDPHSAASLSPCLSLRWKELEAIQIFEDGRAEARFSEGLFLQLRTNDSYEAWQFALLGYVLFISCPGGGVSFFADRE